MDLNNFERGQLQSLQNQETDFDQDAMWKNIEQSKKRRKPIIWLWFSGGISLLLILAGLFCYSSYKTSIINDEHQSLITNLVASNQLEKIEPTLYESTTKIASNEKIIASKKPIVLTKKSKEKHLTPKNSASKFNTEDLTNIPSNTPQVISNSSDSKVVDFPEFFTTKATEKTLNNAIVSNMVVREFNAIEQTKTLEILDQKETIATGATILLKKLPKSPGLVLKTNASTLTPPPIKPLIELKSSLSFYGGIGYQFKRLKLKEKDFRPLIFDIRKNTETVLESFVFGMDLDRKIGRRWNIGTGFEFIVYTEKLVIENRTITNLVNIDRNQRPELYRDREGYILEVKDSVYFNHHRLLNIPVRASYLLNFRGLKLLPEAAVVFNVFQKSVGHVRTTLEQTEQSNAFFKDRIGMSLRFGCKVMIPTGQDLSIFLKPSFEWNPNDVLADNQPIKQKRNLLRLDFGFSRSF